MNKKMGIAIGAVLVVIILVVAILFLKEDKKQSNIDGSQSTAVDSSQNQAKVPNSSKHSKPKHHHLMMVGLIPCNS